MWPNASLRNTVALHGAELHRGGFAKFGVFRTSTDTAIDHYAGSDVWFGHKWGNFRMFLGVASRTQDLNVVTIQGARSVYASGDLVMTVQVFGAATALALANLFDSAKCQSILCIASFGNATFPIIVVLSGRLLGCSRALKRAKSHFISAVFSPSKKTPTYLTCPLQSFARQIPAYLSRARKGACGSLAALMRNRSLVGYAAGLANQGGCHG
jgi:hypothetical protein